MSSNSDRSAAWTHGTGGWLIFALMLSLIWSLGLVMKTHHFELSGVGATHTFWMESAQRYRYVNMVSQGKSLPDPDYKMQAPEGYSPWTDTVLQELLYGTLHRRLAPEAELVPFVRALTPLISSTSIFAVALLVLALTRRKSSALFAGFLFAVAIPLAQRGTGATIFREDIAFPVLVLHLAGLAWWLRDRKRTAALLSGVLLALSLLLWKVLTFYYLLLVGFFATAHWLERSQTRWLLEGAVLTLLPSGLAALLPLSLRADSFLTSASFLSGLAVLGMLALEYFVRGGGRGRRRAGMVVLRPLIAGGFFFVLRWLLPTERGYSHAWETILAKLRFFGSKPADPELLSFHARHYWTGNYESPSLHELTSLWPWLILVALPGLLVVARSWFSPGVLRGELDEDEHRALGAEIPGRSLVDIRLPLSPAAAHFGLWMLVSFGSAFLAFRKLQLFFGLALVVLAALGFAEATRRSWRLGSFWLVPALILVVQSPGLEVRICADKDGSCTDVLTAASDLVQLGVPPTKSEWRAVDVFPSAAFNELASEIPLRVAADEPILASFVISPFILAHLDRPTVLHCFFEGDLLGRLEEVIEARFDSEEALWKVAKEYEARWYLHEAHHLLRTDARMSQRYVADELDWPGQAAVTKMQLVPEELERFELVWENDWFRLFRVLDEGELPALPPPSAGPLWSRSLFESLYWPALGGPGTGEADSEPPVGVPEDMLYATLVASRDLEIAGRLFDVSLRSDDDQAEEQRQHALAYVRSALMTAPFLPEGEELVAKIVAAGGELERTRIFEDRANLLRAALAGQIPLPDRLVPRPVLVDDGR